MPRSKNSKPKPRITLECDQDVYAFWLSLTDGMRTKTFNAILSDHIENSEKPKGTHEQRIAALERKIQEQQEVIDAIKKLGRG